jgi:Zn finger protein HypA/HybF involved in hydrogenase expression
MSDAPVRQLARTLDQELLALVRGASFECPVCGEFVMRFAHAVACPECRSILADGVAVPELELPGTAGACGAS